MKLIKQPKGVSCCGQCCLAMLVNITLEKAIELIGHNGTTRDWELLDHIPDMEVDFSHLGKPIKEHVMLTLLQLHVNPDKPQQKHWTVLHKDKLYDPAEIGANIWPVYKYWVIK